MNCPACETKNPERAKYCLECGQRLPASRTVSSPDRTGFRRRVPAAKPVVRVEGEPRRVVLLCVEVAERSATPQRSDVGGRRDRVSGLLRRFEAVVEGAGGTIDRFHGSGLTAVFGLPEGRDDDGARAVRCALALQDALSEFSAEAAAGACEAVGAGARKRGPRRKSKLPPSPELALRIGVHCGEVIVGGGGTRGVSGDAVTTAQHLMALADADTVHVSRPVQRALQSQFRFRPLPPLHLRGRERFVHPFRLLGPQRTPPWFHTPFVGRELTLARLLEHFHLAASQSRPRFVLVEGAAGMGKSRLVFEFRQQLLDLPQAVTVLQGRCLPHRVTPFGPFGEMLRARLGIPPDATAREALARLESLCARVFPGDPLAPHYLALILGCRMEASPLAFMDVRDAHAGAHYTFKRLLEGMAGGRVPTGRTLFQEAADFVTRVEGSSRRRPAAASPGLPGAPARQAAIDGDSAGAESAPGGGAPRPALAPELLDVLTPVVLVLEEFHWLDTNSLDLLTYLTQTPFYGPILIVGAGRPEGVVGDFLSGKRIGSERWEAVHLEALHPTASARLITAMGQGRMLPAESLERLLRISAGSPFHLEELLKWLLPRLSSASIPPRAAAPELPDSVEELLAARIDSLPPAQRQTLVTAAVMGRLFWRSSLEAVLARPVDDDLRDLEGQGMVFELGDSPFPAGGAQYIFKNVLLRDAAYRTLGEERRAGLHAAMWETLERLDPAILQDHPRVRHFAAHHAVEAGKHWAAFSLYLQAGDQAREARSDIEALEAYGKALEIADRVSPLPAGRAVERVAVLEKHALTLADLRQFDEAEAEFEQAKKKASGPDKARLEMHIGALYGAQGKLRTAARHFRAGLEQAGARSAPLAARLRLELAETLTEGREDLEQAAALAREGLAAAKKQPALQSRAWQILGTLAWLDGKPEEAIANIRRAQKQHEKSDDPIAQCRALHLLGRVHLAQGSLGKAMDHFRKHHDLAERFGYEREVETACLAIGELERLKGRHEPARVAAERAAGIALELGEPRGVARASLLLARIHLEQGEPEGARQLAESALSLFETVQDPVGTAEVRGEFARIHLLSGDFEAARAHAQDYLAAAERSRDSRMMAAASALLGTALHECGEAAAGLRMLERSLTICDRIQDIPCWTACTHRLAQALFAGGKMSLALDLAKSASFAALNMEIAPELGRIQTLLAEIYLDNGLLAEALHSSRKALHQLAGSEGSPARVPALRVCGRALRRIGKDEEGQFRLREAERLATRLGMKAETERCRTALAEAAPSGGA